MSDLYVNQPILIELECQIDSQPMTTGVAATIEVEKPNKSVVSWPGSVNNVTGTVSYEASAADIDQTGTWKLQPVVEFADGKKYPGTTVSMTIKKRFS